MIFNPSKCAFGILREVSWLHGVPARDRGQPEKSTSCIRHAVSWEYQAITAIDQENNCLE
jgi:hypothetical protein